MERCRSWWKEAACLDKKYFTVRFLFCLSVWRQVTTWHAVLHLLQQDSQMLSITVVTPESLVQRSPSPPLSASFLLQLTRSAQRGCPLFHLPVTCWQMKGRGEEEERRREVVASGMKWTEKKKLPTQRNILRVSVADKLSLLVSFTSFAVICNSSDADRGLRITSGWHLPSQETPFF